MKRVLALSMIVAGCSPQPEAANDTDVSNVVENGEASVANAAEMNAAMPPFAEVPNAHPSAPEPAPIPAKFRGSWAETKADCDPKNPSWLGISGRTVRSPNYVLFGDAFTFPAPDQFAIDGRFEGSGEEGAAHYSINAAGDVLTDQGGGGMVRVRCA